jgi:hypothetical protein
MKTKRICAILFAFSLSYHAFAQGTFIYDQQSSDESFISGGVPIQTSQPLGQSFTPSFASINFIRLYLGDLAPANGLGATVLVHLRTNSVSGPILGSSDPVFMPDGYSGVTNFLFPTSVPLMPGATYYFQPDVMSGDGWGTAAYNAYGYPGGMEFFQGTPFPNNDLWFREGIYIPEPPAAVLGFFGIAWLAGARRRRFPSPRNRP